MQGAIRVPNKWLIVIGLLWAIAVAGLIKADGAFVNEHQIGLTPAQALEKARTLPPQLTWEKLYPEKYSNPLMLLQNSTKLWARSASFSSDDTTPQDAAEKMRLLEFAVAEAADASIAAQAAVELAFMLHSQGDPQGAIDLLEKPVSDRLLDPDLHVDAVLILARAHRLLGQEGLAEHLLRSAIADLWERLENHPAEVGRWLYYELGLLLEARGDIAWAHEQFKTTLQWSNWGALTLHHKEHLIERMEREAADVPSVQGHVTLNEQPLAGIQVGLTATGPRNSHTSSPTALSVSDATGRFQMHDVPSGTYEVMVALPGWVPADTVRFEPTRLTVEPETTIEVNVAFEHYPGFQVSARVDQHGEIAWPPHTRSEHTDPAFVELTWETDGQPAAYRIEIYLRSGGSGLALMPGRPSEIDDPTWAELQRQTWEPAFEMPGQSELLDNIVFDSGGLILPGSQSSLKLRLDAPVFTRPTGGGLRGRSSGQLNLELLLGIGDPSTSLQFRVIPLGEDAEPLFGGTGAYRIPGRRTFQSGASEVEIQPPHPKLTEADQLLVAREYEAAIERYEAALEADPYDEHSLFVLWYLYSYGTDYGDPFQNPERASELGERLYAVTDNEATREIIEGPPAK